MSCLFCRIASGAMDVSFVYEDDDFVAFRDIAPAAPVHVLVVPRRHLESIAELGREELWLFPGSEVPTLVDLIEVDEVAVRAPGPRLWSAIDLLRKH